MADLLLRVLTCDRPPYKLSACALALFIAGAVLVSPAAAYQVAPPEPESVFRPADRELRQALTKAERAIAEGEFPEAVDLLGKLLAEGTTEDFFISIGDDNTTRVSMKREAERLLGQLPPKGRELYELQFGADAKALLAAAVREADLSKLSETVRRYFHTKAGWEALVLWGRWQLDQGQALAAALAFQRVAEVPAARTAFDPELTLLTALAWHHAHRPDEARKALAALGDKKLPAGLPPLAGPAEDRLTWLVKVAGNPGQANVAALEQWRWLGGDETRNAFSPGGMPLTAFRWRVLSVNDPRDDQDVREITRRLADQNLAQVPALQPLAIGDTVLMRGAERLQAVDFPTGKLVWEFPPFNDGTSPRGQRNDTTSAVEPRNAAQQRQMGLQQRLWEDAAYGQIASDGDKVYLVHELRPAATTDRRVNVVVGGRRIVNPNYPIPYNELVALDLKGRIQWSVGGQNGLDEPRLAGAFFLGPPLPLQGQLLTLVEFNGEVRLVALDGKTGRLEWSQQIAHMNESTVHRDAPRRLAGVSPSFANGLVICPTAGGAVVAVDWSRRSLAWGYSYRRTAIQQLPRQFGFFGAPPNPTPNEATRWTSAAAIIADGKVILTPPDSAELHCLDVITGKPVWPPRERTDALKNMLYAAGAADGQLLLVGQGSMTSVALKDGSSPWPAAIEWGNAVPTGRGVFAQDYYYVPLSTGELAQIDWKGAQGKIVARMPTEGLGGNLIVHQGNLLALGPQHLTAYYLREPLKRQTDDLLAKNPQDVWALTRKGEIAALEGDHLAGIELLRKALVAKPNDEDVRSSLLKLMMTALRSDYRANAHLAQEMEGLISDPAQRAEYLRLTGDGLAKVGSTRAAFEAYLSLAAITARAGQESRRPASLEKMDATWHVRTDRWLTSRLTALYAAATPEDREHMHTAVQKRLEQFATQPVPRSALSAYFSFAAASQVERLTTAQELIKGGQYLAAEQELQPLLRAAEPRVAGMATAVMAEITEKSQRMAEAAHWLRRLQTEFAAVSVAGEETGNAVVERARSRKPIAGELAAVWPTGRIATPPETERNARTYQRVIPIAVTPNGAVEMPGQQVTLDASRSTIVIRDGVGRIVAETRLVAENNRGYYQSMFAASYGHLLVLATGTEVIAIDTLRPPVTDFSRDGALWRMETTDKASPYPGYGTQPQKRRNPFGAERTYLVDHNGKSLNTSLAVGPWGVAFMRSKQLVCVHPVTGDVLWERIGLEPGAELFGDDQYLFVAPPDKTEATVLDPRDGALLGTRKIDAPEQRWVTSGRHVLSWAETSGDLSLRLYDAWDGRDLWRRTYAIGSRGCIIEGDELAILEPKGRFEVVSLRTGRVRFVTEMQPEPTLMSLHIQRSSRQYCVITNHPATDIPGTRVMQHPAPRDTNSTLVTGYVYALDRETGKPLWTVPAYVHQQGYLSEQPAELPVLVFLRHTTPTQGSAAKTITSILCLDKRTGAVALEANKFPAVIHAYEIVGDPEKQRVQVTMFGASQRTYTVEYTSEPSPPQPPAQLGNMSSLAVGPLGAAVNIADEVFQQLNRPARPFNQP